MFWEHSETTFSLSLMGNKPFFEHSFVSWVVIVRLICHVLFLQGPSVILKRNVYSVCLWIGVISRRFHCLEGKKLFSCMWTCSSLFAKKKKKKHLLASPLLGSSYRTAQSWQKLSLYVGSYTLAWMRVRRVGMEW